MCGLRLGCESSAPPRRSKTPSNPTSADLGGEGGEEQGATSDTTSWRYVSTHIHKRGHTLLHVGSQALAHTYTPNLFAPTREHKHTPIYVREHMCIPTLDLHRSADAKARQRCMWGGGEA